MAIQFYNTIIDEVYGISADPHSSALNVSLTGHSLGGGLVGVNDNDSGFLLKAA
jgi:hypothetical protein